MKYDLQKHHRRSIRLKGYDYTKPGAYFVTVCTQNRACLFGEVVDGEMRLNVAGQLVHDAWQDLARHFAGVALDAFVVMPNHVHGIVVIVGAGRPRPYVAPPPATQPSGAGTESWGAATAPLPAGVETEPSGAGTAPRPATLGQMIAYFKYQSTKRINEMRATPGVPVWQRNYYEHIIRNDQSLNRIRQYILDNPARWAFDRENPQSHAPEPEDAWAQ